MPVKETVTIETVTIETKPTRLPMSYEEFLARIDEDTHAEWGAGQVIIHLPPKLFTKQRWLFWPVYQGCS